MGIDQSLRDFVAEAEDILDSLEGAISNLAEMSPDDHRKPDVINAVFRSAHSLKGLSGMLNLSNLSALSHALENLLDAVRLDKVELSDAVVDALETGVQLLVRMVKAVAEGRGDGTVAYSDFLMVLEETGRGQKAAEGEDLAALIDVPQGMTEMLSEYEEHRFRDNIAKRVPFYRVSCSLPIETFDVELESMGKAIREMGELLTTLPQTDMGGGGTIGFTLYFTTRAPEDEVRRRIALEGRKFEAVPYRAAPAGKGVKKAARTAPRPEEESDGLEEEVKGVSNTVRVDINKLDVLMNLVGELVILRSGYTNIAARLRESGAPGDLQMILAKSNSSMEKKLIELRDSVMGIRMVPMGHLYNRLHRVSKKVARELGKKVEFEFIGGDTELDKMIMEQMVSPLLHMVRNSVDHGIESEKERAAAGKPALGRVRLSAFQQGNHVVLEMVDDGKGIDLEKVRQAAIRRGEIGADDSVTEEEVISFLFKPGFSTKDDVTEISGRGVGLDVVRKELERIGGNVEMRTEKGRGTRVTLTLPITLAILQALLVRSGARVFAVPMGSILETISLGTDQVKTLQGREVITLRDRTLPLLRLEDLFGLERSSSDGSLFAVIVGMANRTMALAANELIGKQDIVIKPLGEAFSRTVGLAGAAELGDQSTILVLDVAGLMMEAVRLGTMARKG